MGKRISDQFCKIMPKGISSRTLSLNPRLPNKPSSRVLRDSSRCTLPPSVTGNNCNYVSNDDTRWTESAWLSDTPCVKSWRRTPTSYDPITRRFRTGSTQLPSGDRCLYWLHTSPFGSPLKAPSGSPMCAHNCRRRRLPLRTNGET